MNDIYDVIVVGAGVAGLTSSIYLRRAEKKVLILEKMAYGGQIINTLDIENYPSAEHISGFDLATKIYNQAKGLGAEIKYQEVIEIKDNGDYKEVVTNKETYTAKAVILAVGSANRKLGLENEDNLLGRGISYCATCDGHFYKGKNVAVVGGGNTALEDAIYLSDIVNEVYLIHRRDEFRADVKTIGILNSKTNIKVIYNSNVTKLNANGKLESIEVTNKDGSTGTIDVDGLFVAVGRIPENKIFEGLIDLDEYGYAIASEDCHTKTAGIFVAGDNRQKSLRQLTTAVSDGAVAATEAIKYINS